MLGVVCLPLKVVTVKQLLLAGVGLGGQLRPLIVDLALLGIRLFRRVGVRRHQPGRCVIELANLQKKTHTKLLYITTPFQNDIMSQTESNEKKLLDGRTEREDRWNCSHLFILKEIG